MFQAQHPHPKFAAHVSPMVHVPLTLNVETVCQERTAVEATARLPWLAKAKGYAVPPAFANAHEDFGIN